MLVFLFSGLKDDSKGHTTLTNSLFLLLSASFLMTDKCGVCNRGDLLQVA